jgi:hypothetical protein
VAILSLSFEVSQRSVFRLWWSLLRAKMLLLRWHVPLNRLYPPTRLHGVTTHNPDLRAQFMLVKNTQLQSLCVCNVHRLKMFVQSLFVLVLVFVSVSVSVVGFYAVFHGHRFK